MQETRERAATVPKPISYAVLAYFAGGVSLALLALYAYVF
ncbi:MAG: hypothetical protein Kow00122_02440 [Thermoleophilia bacterium]